MNAIDLLQNRGFIKQIVFKDELYEKLNKESIVFYVGFDPTADSLHVGHFVQLMAMKHMQNCGHKPIVLIGGGTTMVGDPSGRTDMRSMMTKEAIEQNGEVFKKQMSKFFSFEGKNAAIMVNNADWLLKLNYVDFLRDVGALFSVNKMLTAECFKQRLEKGLSFLEFNYMLMQSYDFLVLHDKYKCILQIGGDDQWSNILQGADLIRRKTGDVAYALTTSLLVTTEGKKMGKTSKGALWLSGEKTSPYDFYQYFRNVQDDDVANCLKLLTFLDLSEIESLTKFKDERINIAKERLAYEVTKLIHGEDAAKNCEKMAKAAFSDNAQDMPGVKLEKMCVKILDVLVGVGAAPSKSEARRLIDGGGVYINDTKITDVNYEIPNDLLKKGFILHKGKKMHIKISY